LPLHAANLALLTGWPIFWWFGRIFVFGIIPVLDYLIGDDPSNRALPASAFVQQQSHRDQNRIVTNLFLYQLQRHADHHANPTRSYQALRDFDGAPQLPSGYATMIMLAYVPPLWFRVMNPRVVAHYQGDMAQSNIRPAIRERVLARFAG
jgi:hypothetical protein